MNLDEIGYGTPTIQNLKIINKETYLDGAFSDLTSFTFPKNGSDATKEELNHVCRMLELTKRDEGMLKRYVFYDRDIKSIYFKTMIGNGADSQRMIELLESVESDTLPLLMKLKFFFQRPRPFQLAYYHKLKLMPYKSISSDSPSFPSGHAYQSKLFFEVLGNHYPEMYGVLKELHEDICQSRVGLGLHYQSDIDVGIFAAEVVLRKKEFAIKYKI